MVKRRSEEEGHEAGEGSGINRCRWYKLKLLC